MLRDVPTRVLLVAGFLTAAAVPLVVFALVTYEASRSALKAQALRQLESARTLERDAVERSFRDDLTAVSLLARDPGIAAAFGELCGAFREGGGAAGRAFVGHDAGRFDAPAAYRATHDRHAAHLGALARDRGFYDLLLLDAASGEVCFSVQKESDFGAPAGAGTALADVLRRAKGERRPVLSDTRPYPPSANAAAQFAAAPIVGGDGVAGVVVLQIGTDSIDAIMGERAGMGRTGETYLVGADGRLRSNSRVDPSRTVERAFRGEVRAGAIDEHAVRHALAGETGSGVLRERDGRARLTAWAPVDVGGATWAVVGVIDEREIEAQIDAALNTKTIVVLGASSVLGVALALLVSLAFARAVGGASAEVVKLGDAVLAGDLAARGDPDAVASDLRDVVRKVNGLVDALVRVRDEKQRLEERVARMQRLEAIGTLAGGIAHDFNNILTSIFAHLHVLEREAGASARAASSLRQMTAGLDRATDLVRQVLTFSRKLHVEPTVVDLGATAVEALELVRAGLPRGARLEVDVPPRPFFTRADATQLHQLVVNLAINAIQALGPRGGRVAVRLGEETLADGDPRVGATLRPGPYVTLEVADDGQGIDVHTLARIFEPFFTTKPVGQGTGMGLALVHGVVTTAGGAVFVESAVGAGSTFRVLLPRCEAPSPAAADAGAKGAVLFVDDEPHVGHVAAQLLATLGYDAVTAPGGREAIDAFAARPGDFVAVVTDLAMPEVSGLEVAAAVRALRADVLIVLGTTHTDLVAPDRVASAGVTEVLVKPYRRSALARVLASAPARAG